MQIICKQFDFTVLIKSQTAGQEAAADTAVHAFLNFLSTFDADDPRLCQPITINQEKADAVHETQCFLRNTAASATAKPQIRTEDLGPDIFQNFIQEGR